MASRPTPTTNLVRMATRMCAEPPGGIYSIRGSMHRPRIRREDECCDLDDLIGVVAPIEWYGVGLVIGGHARDIDPAGSPRSNVEGNVTVAVAMDRAGRSGSIALTLDDGIEHRLRGPIRGPVADLLRRTMGLSCPAEHRGTELLINSEWLDEILHTVADPATAHLARTWDDVVALHPLYATATPSFTCPTPFELAGAMVDCSQRCDWTTLRRLASDSPPFIAGLRPEGAAWLDDGSFARWMLGVHRPFSDVLDDLSLFMSGPTLAAVHATQRALDWLRFVPSEGSHRQPGDR